jgi:cell shape-determining protein MreC
MAQSNADRSRAYRQRRKEAAEFAARTHFGYLEKRLAQLEDLTKTLLAEYAALEKEVLRLQAENHRLRTALLDRAVPT